MGGEKRVDGYCEISERVGESGISASIGDGWLSVMT